MRSGRISLIPLRSLVYLAGGLAAVFLLVFLGLRPLQGGIQRLDAEAAALQTRLAQQQGLAPLSRDFTTRLTQDAGNRLPATNKARLSLEQVIEMPPRLQQMARECGLEAAAVAPEAKSFTKDRKSIPVNLVLQGNFLNLRKFLFSLANLPCLEHIEEIQIQEIGGAQEFRLKAWVAVNPQKSS